MIKRPVLELGGGKILVGFTPADYGETVTAWLVPRFLLTSCA
jgi:hypothetical protein